MWSSQDHKWGGPGPSSCACPGSTYVHIGPCGNQILIMKFYKNENWKKLKLGFEMAIEI